MTGGQHAHAQQQTPQHVQQGLAGKGAWPDESGWHVPAGGGRGRQQPDPAGQAGQAGRPSGQRGRRLHEPGDRQRQQDHVAGRRYRDLEG